MPDDAHDGLSRMSRSGYLGGKIIRGPEYNWELTREVEMCHGIKPTSMPVTPFLTS